MCAISGIVVSNEYEQNEFTMKIQFYEIVVVKKVIEL